jgi:16S rRNA (uracil1498-N3)-methyltransferase
VNIILFDLPETLSPLPRTDPRATHILDVLRRRPGDDFDAGLIDGPRGKATLVSVQDSSLSLSFVWGEEPPPLDPITLIVGLPRPQTARKVLQEATSLGVCAMHFVTSEKGEAGYARSVLWSSGEWRRHLIAGAQQAFCTRLPELTHDLSLREAMAALAPANCRLALDNYEASEPLSQAYIRHPATIALGPERGWSDGERDLLRESGFHLVHLGPRVLRSETACVAAITLVKAKLGLL